MKTIFPASLFLILAASLMGAAPQGLKSPGSNAGDDEVITLDEMLVSAGPDEKTLFDLAQGSAILNAENLQRHRKATLGETLSATAGVTSTYYGPGASRPIIRGLGGDRIRVLADNIGALDASNISPDHNVAMEPLFASRIEVLRGPSTLLYGSSAVGGVINVIENRIPTEPSPGKFTGTIEARGFGAADTRAGVAALNAGTSSLSFQIDAMREKADDTRIPGVARVDAEAPSDQPQGIIPNSASDTEDISLGSAVFWDGGRIGAAFRHYDTLYDVPSGEGEVSIDMHQNRFDLAAEITEPFAVFRSARLRLGIGRYKHQELDDGEVATTFRNKAWEGRLELPHAAIGPLSGTVGAQAAYSDFSAVGDEVATPPSVTRSNAFLLLEEFKTGKATVQFGLRRENQSIRLDEVDADLPSVSGYAATSGERRTFSGTSASVGLVTYPAEGYSIGVSVAYTERLPTAQELFSNGPHGGTAAYEVGSTGFENEKSLGFDLSLRKRLGRATGMVSAFVNRFSGFIFERELPQDAIPEEDNPDGLTPYQFTARDARFYGGEAEIRLHLIETKGRDLHLELMGDYVHATNTTDRESLPRIAPFRLGAHLSYTNGPWKVGAGVRHVFRQKRVATSETDTPGYTLVSADIVYRCSMGGRNFEWFTRGENLVDKVARTHTSFLKEFAPLPGRSVVAGVRMEF